MNQSWPLDHEDEPSDFVGGGEFFGCLVSINFSRRKQSCLYIRLPLKRCNDGTSTNCAGHMDLISALQEVVAVCSVSQSIDKVLVDRTQTAH
jgi:hypothetical protein